MKDQEEIKYFSSIYFNASDLCFTKFKSDFNFESYKKILIPICVDFGEDCHEVRLLRVYVMIRPPKNDLQKAPYIKLTVCITLIIQLSHIQGHGIHIVLYALLDSDW
jgi:hypothetical protein